MHPLIDLHLFKNRQLTIAVITMSLFAIAFFGAGLLFPSYFLQVRGETTLAAGLLLAPQGFGAMLSMPVAGSLADKIGVGRIVPVGITLIAVGLAVFTQVGAHTSYVLLIGSLFVMGLGMGSTMMPIMTAALQTLTDHTLARGSTLMNIVQQVAGSIGTAVISVILTNAYQSRDAADTLIRSAQNPELAARLTPASIARGLDQMADSFGVSFMVATALIVLCLAPAALLPRRKAAVPVPVRDDVRDDVRDETTLPPVLVH